MHRHIKSEDIANYAARRLSPTDLVRVLDHLGACETCARRLAEVRGRAVLPWGGPETGSIGTHIGEDELVLWVAGRLGVEERVRVEAHVAGCRECGDAAHDLRAFERELETAHHVRTAARTRYRWLTAAAAVLIAVAMLPLALRREPAARSAPVLAASLRDAAGVIGVTASGELMGIAAPGDEDLLKQALRTGTLPAGPALSRPTRPVQRGAPARAPAFQPRYPVGNRVFATSPEFEWTALSGASGYEVKAFDSDFHEVARSGRLTSTHWQPGTPLERGRSYVWQVIAMRGGQRIAAPEPPEPEARFEVLDTATADRIERARGSGSHLLLAGLYAREGLVQEASAELDALALLNPGSELVTALKRTLTEPR